MRGKKGIPHTDPADPPRRRGNKQQGHGTWDIDRPPLAAVLGRQSRRLRLRLVRRAFRAALEALVGSATRPGTRVYTDAWGAYQRLPQAGRGHAAVNHEAGEWARDDDGDGVREVHCNTLEGIWTGFRAFLRPFRGVSKWYLAQYAAVYQWAFDLKQVSDGFLAMLLGRPFTTIPGA
jgi:hypothetical protein